jgi:hypothetical protein
LRLSVVMGVEIDERPRPLRQHHMPMRTTVRVAVNVAPVA